MSAIAAIILASSTAATPPISVGIWCSDEIEVCMKFKGMKFDMFEYGGGKFASCRIVSWPISSPIAHAKCTDKIDRDVRIDFGKVEMNGQPMTWFKDEK